MVSNLSGAEILRLVRLDRRSHRGGVGGLGGYTTTVYKTITADLAETCVKFRKSTVFYSRAAENYEQERHGSSTGQYCFLRDPRMNNTIITFLLCSGFLPSTYSQVNALQGVCKRVSTLVQRGQVELNLTGYVLRKGHRMDKKHNQDQNDERMIVSTSIRGGQGHALSAYTTLRTLRLDYCDVNLTVEEHGIEGNEDEEKEKEKKEREYKQHVAKRQRSVGTEDDRNASTSGTYGSADPASARTSSTLPASFPTTDPIPASAVLLKSCPEFVTASQHKKKLLVGRLLLTVIKRTHENLASRICAEILDSVDAENMIRILSEEIDHPTTLGNTFVHGQELQGEITKALKAIYVDDPAAVSSASISSNVASANASTSSASVSATAATADEKNEFEMIVPLHNERRKAWVLQQSTLPFFLIGMLPVDKLGQNAINKRTAQQELKSSGASSYPSVRTLPSLIPPALFSGTGNGYGYGLSAGMVMLGLRGCNIDDSSCELLSMHLRQLRYLDVSKVSELQRHSITDRGGMALVSRLSLLVFLGVARTGVGEGFVTAVVNRNTNHVLSKDPQTLEMTLKRPQQLVVDATGCELSAEQKDALSRSMETIHIPLTVLMAEGHTTHAWDYWRGKLAGAVTCPTKE